MTGVGLRMEHFIPLFPLLIFVNMEALISLMLIVMGHITGGVLLIGTLLAILWDILIGSGATLISIVLVLILVDSGEHVLQVGYSTGRVVLIILLVLV
jgi:hypothetical protein